MSAPVDVHGEVCRLEGWHDDSHGMADALNGRPLPGWLLDEVAGAGRENVDVEHVARYDAKEHADADEELVLLKELGLHR